MKQYNAETGRNVPNTFALSDDDQSLAGYILCKVKDIAKDLGLNNGYRLVVNCGEDGFQTVKHLHFHLIGGKKMGWPPYVDVTK